MKYRILEERKIVPEPFTVEEGIVWVCRLCKKAYGEGEVIGKLGVNYVCPDCKGRTLSWMRLPEFLKKFSSEEL